MVLDLLQGLNNAQQKAVLYNDGPLLILASAGSGKTRVITHKIAYLIKHNKVSARNILALTFTNKAASEMKSRLTLILGREAKYLMASTFHSFAYKMLKQEIVYLPEFKENFSIYSESDSISSIRKIMHEYNIPEDSYQPKTLLSIFSRYKNSYFKDLIENSTVAQIYQYYQHYLVSHNAMDFDDLLINFYEIIEKNAPLLEKLQNQFAYILVDEYQDTNNLQYLLIQLLAKKHRRISCCGDDDQGIYGFRGASIENILNFEKDFPDAKTILLDVNYRSTETIIKASAEVIKNNVYRKEKQIIAHNKQENKIVFRKNEYPEDEAKFVLDLIYKNLYDKGINYRDIAVLYRNNYQSRQVEELFRFKEVPYKVYNGMNFYDREEIRDIIQYMFFIINPSDEISLLKIINTPRRGIGAKLVNKLNSISKEHSIPIFSIIEASAREKSPYGLSDNENLKLYEFYKTIFPYFKDIYNVYQLPRNLRKLVQDIHYEDYLKKLYDEKAAVKKMQNLESFFQSLYYYQKSEENENITIWDIMAKLRFLTQEDSQDNSEDDNKVNFLTIHSSKGLEFRIIFLIGMEEDIIPSETMLDDKGIEEERRLFYVGMTRAKEKLYISFCEKRKKYGKDIDSSPSMFLDEIPEQYYEFEEGEHKNKIDVKDFSKLKNLLMR